MTVPSLLQWFADNASLLICCFAAVHFLVLLVLRVWWGRTLLTLKDYLRSLLANIKGTSDPRSIGDLDDQIEAFLHDVRAILTQEQFQHERDEIRTRVIAKKEQRPYLRAKAFERWYSVARAAVEIYPLAGILGTILAMAVSLAPGSQTASVAGPAAGNSAAVANADQAVASASTDGEELAAETAVAGIVTNFRSAIWSTFFGLLFAILFMGLTAWYEPSFVRLVEYRAAVLEAIREAERSMVATGRQGGQS
jgi:hypothetical protein